MNLNVIGKLGMEGVKNIAKNADFSHAFYAAEIIIAYEGANAVINKVCDKVSKRKTKIKADAIVANTEKVWLFDAEDIKPNELEKVAYLAKQYYPELKEQEQLKVELKVTKQKEIGE